MRQPGGRDWHHSDALLIYDERIFVGAVSGTSIFDKPETTGRQLIFDAIIQEDNAVSDVLFESITCQRAFAPLAGDDGSHAFFFQPGEEPRSSERNIN